MKMTKVCTRCKVIKPVVDFPFRKQTGKLHSWCRPCCRKQGRDWRAANYERAREHQRRGDYRKSYDISIEDYEKAYKDQEGMCKICGKYHAVLHVDHNHEYGFVRGLLCGNCNRMLGMAQDNIHILKAAYEYMMENDL
jgi:hypothetical protein